jgi:hypothetical protein
MVSETVGFWYCGAAATKAGFGSGMRVRSHMCSRLLLMRRVLLYNAYITVCSC